MHKMAGYKVKAIDRAEIQRVYCSFIRNINFPYSDGFKKINAGDSLVAPASQIIMPVGIPTLLLPILLPANAPEKAMRECVGAYTLLPT